AVRAGRAQPRFALPPAADAGREPDQHLRGGQRHERVPAERADRRSEPPWDHAPHAAADPVADLPAARARSPATALARGVDRVPAGGRAGDPLAQRGAGSRRRRARPALPVPAPAVLAAGAVAARAGGDPGAVRALPPAALLQRRDPLPDLARYAREHAPPCLTVHPVDPTPA